MVGSISKQIGFESFHRGDSFAYKLEFDDTAFDLTDLTFITSFKVSKSDTDKNSILVKRFIAPDNAESRAGIMYFIYTKDETKRFNAGRYFYDIQMISAGAIPKIFTILDERVLVKDEVTILET